MGLENVGDASTIFSRFNFIRSYSLSTVELETCLQTSPNDNFGLELFTKSLQTTFPFTLSSCQFFPIFIGTSNVFLFIDSELDSIPSMATYVGKKKKISLQPHTYLTVRVSLSYPLLFIILIHSQKTRS